MKKRINIDLPQETYDLLVKKSVECMRSVKSMAEVIIILELQDES